MTTSNEIAEMRIKFNQFFNKCEKTIAENEMLKAKNESDDFIQVDNTGFGEIMKFITDSKFDMINEKNKILWKATELGRLDVIKYFCKDKITNEMNIHSGFVVLAAIYNHLDIIKYFHINKVDMHNDSDGALRAAVKNNNLDIVKYLIEETEANFHAMDEWALRMAAECGHLEIVNYLINCDPENHSANSQALKCAFSKGHIELVKYLINEVGAKID